jgi:Flp pilus assembly protein TadD
MTLEKQGDTATALRHYAKALEVAPGYPLALNHMAWIRATSADASLRGGEEAVKLAERLCGLSAQPAPRHLDTLAAAYAEAGRFREAVETATTAVETASAGGETGLAEQIQGRLILYSEGVPFRDSRH